MRVVIVGRGALGTALGRVLRDHDVACASVAGRNRPTKSARVLENATLVILAVPDPAIQGVATAIAPLLADRCVVIHAAGSRTTAELTPIRARGLEVGVLHPMVSFAAGANARSFDGATFVGWGDPGAIRAARKVARYAGARFVRADVHGSVYHAASSMVANGAVALTWASVELLIAQGFAKRDAERALSGLLATVARNIAEVGVPAALTGPIARGDAGTVLRHREALAASSSTASATYDAVGPTILACAVARGLDSESARSVADALATTPQRPRRRAKPRS